MSSCLVWPDEITSTTWNIFLEKKYFITRMNFVIKVLLRLSLWHVFLAASSIFLSEHTFVELSKPWNQKYQRFYCLHDYLHLSSGHHFFFLLRRFYHFWRHQIIDDQIILSNSGLFRVEIFTIFLWQLFILCWIVFSSKLNSKELANLRNSWCLVCS